MEEDLPNESGKQRKTFEKGYYKTHRCNDTFSCRVCDRLVFPTPTGGDHRNHCPNCLSSLHVDQEPGDRAADCGGIMDPIGVWVRKKEEWAVIHRVPPVRQAQLQPGGGG